MNPTQDTRIAIIGLGYVGLPLAVEFGKRTPVTGFDIKGNAEQVPAVRAELVEALGLTGLRFDRLNANGLNQCFPSRVASTNSRPMAVSADIRSNARVSARASIRLCESFDSPR